MKITAKKSRRVSHDATDRKQFSRLYSLASKRVCKKVFLGTLKVSNGRVDRLAKKGDSPQVDGRGHHNNRVRKVSDQVVEKLRKVLDDVPKYTSHYGDVEYTPENIVYLAPS